MSVYTYNQIIISVSYAQKNANMIACTYVHITYVCTEYGYILMYVQYVCLNITKHHVLKTVYGVHSQSVV